MRLNVDWVEQASLTAKSEK